MLNKKIGIGHFVYNIIIALLIITFTVVLAFGGDKEAGNQVNVMATGISIILAVIAILMTLVDVAGQRQSIVEIKETAEKLTITQEKSQEALRETIETIERLNGFREELLSSVTTYKNGTEDLIKNLSKRFSEKETVTKQEIEEDIQHFNKNTSNLDFKLKRLSNLNSLSNYEQRFQEFVRMSYALRNLVPLSELEFNLKNGLLDFNADEIEMIKEDLLNLGCINKEKTHFFPTKYESILGWK
ncbi:hypothetical protein [Bacillus altitudinis]|uniref:hypothetical protein n=1 Tax=Bacillus altitudinis TaxID=293387 RepID=UPI0011A93674|nr:hypothetical protein [Bacillus altitudinis]